MSLSRPIYKRGRKYTLHLRIEGKQVKRSLGTMDPALARVRAIQLMAQPRGRPALGSWGIVGAGQIGAASSPQRCNAASQSMVVSCAPDWAFASLGQSKTVPAVTLNWLLG